MTDLSEIQREFIEAVGWGEPDRVQTGFPNRDTMVITYGTREIAVTGRELRMNRDRMRWLAKVRVAQIGFGK